MSINRLKAFYLWNIRYKYSGSNNPDAVAWFYDNSGGRTHPVGTKQPNELGLYDMSGNVDEWCADWYDENYYSKSPNQNPTGPSSGKLRVLRNGDWSNSAKRIRCANRDGRQPDRRGGYGFRCVR